MPIANLVLAPVNMDFEAHQAIHPPPSLHPLVKHIAALSPLFNL